METNTGNTSSEGDERILTPTDMQTKGASVTLELGDIIEIIAPSNPDIHEMNALITYIDIHKLKLINVLIVLFILSVIIHKIFCVETTLTKLLCNVKKIKCKKEIILGNFNGFYTIYSKKIVSKNSKGEYTFDNFYKNNKVFINGKECVSFHLFPEVYIEKNHTDKIKKLYNNLAVCIGQVEY